MKSTETLSGVFDLGRDNIQDVYDISESPMPQSSPGRSNPTSADKSNDDAHEQKKFHDPTNLKDCVLKYQQILLIILLIIVLIAAGIGITFIVVKGSGMLDSYQNKTALKLIKRLREIK